MQNDEREKLLRRQIAILADRFVLAVVILCDGRAFVDPDIIKQLDYFQDNAAALLDVESMNEAKGVSRKHDHVRHTEMYSHVKNMVRGMLRRQVVEDMKQPREVK